MDLSVSNTVYKEAATQDDISTQENSITQDGIQLQEESGTLQEKLPLIETMI